MKRTYKLTLEYDGTRYSGWQAQANARTVMGDLIGAAQDLFQTGVEVMGAGRTDAGVHAAAQVAHLRVTPREALRPERILAELNRRLPHDIAILELDEAPARFHARHDAAGRVYTYQIATRKTAFSKKYVWWIKEPLGVERMREAAGKIPGRHDFACFRAEDPSKPDGSTIVVVESAEIEVQDGMIVFRIEASHFLWRMVRRLVGALVKTGLGELPPQAWDRLLQGRCAAEWDIAAWTAPASGLFLSEVKYKPRP
ncbi:MAG: tRNA pseudouridine(38-40) synthase TruA [Bryobacterales bacterium]|nr:tRNA pseudouridine(38-40) synthase TruA [Bryobacterales bacterium]